MCAAIYASCLRGVAGPHRCRRKVAASHGLARIFGSWECLSNGRNLCSVTTFTPIPSGSAWHSVGLLILSLSFFQSKLFLWRALCLRICHTSHSAARSLLSLSRRNETGEVLFVQWHVSASVYLGVQVHWALLSLFPNLVGAVLCEHSILGAVQKCLAERCQCRLLRRAYCLHLVAFFFLGGGGRSDDLVVCVSSFQSFRTWSRSPFSVLELWKNHRKIPSRYEFHGCRSWRKRHVPYIVHLMSWLMSWSTQTPSTCFEYASNILRKWKRCHVCDVSRSQ